jgi:outer membrane protein
MSRTITRASASHRARRLPAALLHACLIAIATLCLAPQSAAAAKNKIAVIDLRRAVADTEDGLRVQAKLQQMIDSRQSDYESKEKAYLDSKAAFEKLAKTKKTSEKVLRKKYAALEKMASELQAAQVNYRREMQRQENELTYPIIMHMQKLMRRLSAQSGYDMVLSKEAVPYYRADLDITDRIIQMYNASQSTGSGGKKPAGKVGPKGPRKKGPPPSKGKPKAPKG